MPSGKTFVPLAERLRPGSLEEVVGQEGVIGPDTPLGAAVRAGRVPSFVLWGPPGTGKTTIARLVSERVGAVFEPLRAVTAGVKDVRAVIARATERAEATILFVDEVHRFNKAQQDAFLHSVEDGTLVLIGATTENPSFELNSPLLSRLKVFVLAPLDRAALEEILERGLEDLAAEIDEEARDAREHGTLPVPLSIRNAPTRLMRELGYGKGYVYDHDTADGVSGQQCRPNELEGRRYYEPGRFGFEKEIRRRMEYWEQLRRRGEESS